MLRMGSANALRKYGVAEILIMSYPTDVNRRLILPIVKKRICVRSKTPETV
jgi:hypothetical protein